MKKLIYIIGSLILIIASLMAIIAAFDWDNVFNFMMSNIVKSGSGNWVPVLICFPFVLGLLVILAGCCMKEQTENLTPEAMPLLPLRNEHDIFVSPREADNILNAPTVSNSEVTPRTIEERPMSPFSSEMPNSPNAPVLDSPPRIPKKPRVIITPPQSPPGSPPSGSPKSTHSEYPTDFIKINKGTPSINLNNLFAKTPKEAQIEKIQRRRNKTI